MPKLTGSYSNAIDNLKVKNSLEKVHRIHKNDVQNLQVTRAEFSFFDAEFRQP